MMDPEKPIRLIENYRRALARYEREASSRSRVRGKNYASTLRRLADAERKIEAYHKDVGPAVLYMRNLNLIRATHAAAFEASNPGHGGQVRNFVNVRTL